MNWAKTSWTNSIAKGGGVFSYGEQLNKRLRQIRNSILYFYACQGISVKQGNIFLFICL